jgi:hypothetical protein
VSRSLGRRSEFARAAGATGSSRVAQSAAFFGRAGSTTCSPRGIIGPWPPRPATNSSSGITSTGCRSRPGILPLMTGGPCSSGPAVSSSRRPISPGGRRRWTSAGCWRDSGTRHGWLSRSGGGWPRRQGQRTRARQPRRRCPPASVSWAERWAASLDGCAAPASAGRPSWIAGKARRSPRRTG